MRAVNRFFMFGVCLLVLSSVAAGQTSEIQWQQNLEAAKRQARETGKLVLVHFWADWCGACLRFENTVFRQPEASRAIQDNYIAVKLHADHFPSTARAMGVRTLPTDIIITPDGREVARFATVDQRRRVATAKGFAGEITRVAGVHKPGPTATIAARTPQITPPQPTRQSGNSAVPPASNPYMNIGKPSGSVIGPQGAVSPQNASKPYQGMGVQQPAIQTPTASRYGTHAPQLPSHPAPTQPMTRPGATSYTPNYSAPQPGNQYSQQAVQPAASISNQPTTMNSPANRFLINGGSGTRTAARYGIQQTPQATLSGLTTNTAPSQTNVVNHPAMQTQTPTMFGTPPAVATQTQNAPSRSIAQAPTQQTAPFVTQPVAPRNSQPALNQPVSGKQAPNQAAQNGNPALGLDGYCPVSLQHEQRWVVGDRRWGAIHEGHTYLFMGPTQQQQFLANPNLYSPVLAGADPVLALETSQNVPGNRRHGVVYDSHVFLFSSEATLQRFTQDPDRYANGIRQAKKLSRDQMPPR